MTGSPADRLFFLRNSAGIDRVKKSGRRFPTPLFNLVSFASGGPHTRIGIVVGRRLGGAVTRNRAKRIFRELAREVRQDLVKGYDVLVFPRREALTVGHTHLRDAWASALRHEGLLITHLDVGCDESALG
jgi:ribonuclease P protein component